MTEQPWKILIMIHRMTVTSRDFDTVTTKYGTNEPLMSLEDCKECAKYWALNYASMGYRIGQCTATSPEGEQFHDLVTTYSYR